MSICPNAKDLNIDAISLLDGCLVCGAGSIEVIGHAVGGVDVGRIESQLFGDGVADGSCVGALIVCRKPNVFVKGKGAQISKVSLTFAIRSAAIRPTACSSEQMMTSMSNLP